MTNAAYFNTNNFIKVCDMNKTGKDIVRYIGSLPLVEFLNIRIVGAFTVTKTFWSEWTLISASLLFYPLLDILYRSYYWDWAVQQNKMNGSMSWTMWIFQAVGCWILFTTAAIFIGSFILLLFVKPYDPRRYDQPLLKRILRFFKRIFRNYGANK